ncbi:MAG TPA: hypothetical protein VGX49_03080 [Jatrophihabitans sp.]|jgi:hypothetical protein|nr:hypothetical protein [Jatrophihabitans sp.]
MKATLSKAVVGATLAASVLLLVPAASSSATPVIGPNQSRVTNYYQTDEFGRNLVGQRGEGWCGADFTWGITTNDYSFQVITCDSN